MEVANDVQVQNGRFGINKISGRYLLAAYHKNNGVAQTLEINDAETNYIIKVNDWTSSVTSINVEFIWVSI